MVKILKVSDDAHSKVEIFSKDSGLSMQEAATKLILTNIDIATAQNYQQNNNCIWDLYAVNLDGSKDFSCMMKRQFPQLRDPAQLDALINKCKICPRRMLVKDLFKFEKMLNGNNPIRPANPQPDRAAAIKAEIAKDNMPEPRPLDYQNKAANMPVVQCDNCGQQFYSDSSAVELTKDLNQHIKEAHSRTTLTQNERNQVVIAFRMFRKLQEAKEVA